SARRSDLSVAGRALPRQIERFVIRQDDVRGIADLQVVIDAYTHAAQLLDLFEQRLGVDDHSIAEDAELVRMEDAGGDESQSEMLIGELDRVSGVMPALISRDYVVGLAEKIDDLSLAFVAPLRSHDPD